MEQTIAHDHIKLMMHCIGLDQQRPYTRHGKWFYRSYRNRFVTRAGLDFLGKHLRIQIYDEKE